MSTKTRNSKNKRMTNFYLKSSSIKKNSNSCPWNTTRSKALSRSSRKKNFRLITNYSSIKKILNSFRSKNSIQKIHKKKTILFANSSSKTESLSTSSTHSKVTWFSRIQINLQTIKSPKMTGKASLLLSSMISSETNWLNW